MLRIALILSLITWIHCSASAQVEKYRDINLYTVIIKTKKETLKGILKQATDSTIIIQTKSTLKSIPVNSIKTIKIKFAYQKSYKFFENVAHAGMRIIVNDIDNPTDSYSQPTYEALDNTTNPLSDIGGHIILGTAVTATALAENELTKLLYKPNIEVFKIKQDYNRYQGMKDDIMLYTEHLQLSPEYEDILLQQLKSAVAKTKWKK